MSESDIELLGRYRRDHSEAAFSEIVRRHLALVHSAALRQVRRPELAEEIAQTTFLELVRQADRLGSNTQLAAWLYETTRRNAVDVIRRETRRDARERTAMELNSLNAGPSEWNHLEPVLDDAMAELLSTDRAAILLRYFENRSLRDVGAALGVSDDAAQKRVSRAVDELRTLLTKRGVTMGAGALVVALSANAVQAAPAALVLTISACAAKAVFTAAVPATAMTALTKSLIAASAVGIALAVYQGFTSKHLHAEIRNLAAESSELSAKLEQSNHDRDQAKLRSGFLEADLSNTRDRLGRMVTLGATERQLSMSPVELQAEVRRLDLLSRSLMRAASSNLVTNRFSIDVKKLVEEMSHTLGQNLAQEIPTRELNNWFLVYLEKKGISVEPPASFFINDRAGILLVRNTPRDIAAMTSAIDRAILKQ